MKHNRRMRFFSSLLDTKGGIPVEEKHSEEGTHQCLQCSATSDQRVLLPCEQDGEEKWVCVRCLPSLIHGEH